MFITSRKKAVIPAVVVAPKQEIVIEVPTKKEEEFVKSHDAVKNNKPKIKGTRY